MKKRWKKTGKEHLNAAHQCTALQRINEKKNEKNEKKTGKEHLNAAHLATALQRIARHLVLGEVFLFLFPFFLSLFLLSFFSSFFGLDTTSNSTAMHCTTPHGTNVFIFLFHERTNVFLSRKIYVLTEHTFTVHTFFHCSVYGTYFHGTHVFTLFRDRSHSFARHLILIYMYIYIYVCVYIYIYIVLW